MTAALEPGAEESFTALILAVTGCDLEMEGGTEPATTLVITIATVPDDIPEYDRSDWRHWIDEDGDCQDARQESPHCRESGPGYLRDRPAVPGGSRTGGTAPSPPSYVDDPEDLDIDHHGSPEERPPIGSVGLEPGHERGVRELSGGPENHLIAVTASANRSKGAKGTGRVGAAGAMGYWCQYATDWAVIKEKWGLTMTPVESAEAVMDMLGTCENPPEFEVDDKGWPWRMQTWGCIRLRPRRSRMAQCTNRARKRSPRGSREFQGKPGRRPGLPEGDGPVRAGRGRRRYSV